MQTPTDKKIGYAIVGLGKLSLEQLLPAFSKCENSIPVALVSGDPEKAACVAKQYGIDPAAIYNYENYDEIANNPAIDVVYIVLPNNMHEEYTIRAARAGKHVLCEKPMATSTTAALRMINACKEAARKLMIAYRVQYEPHHAKIKEWVQTRKYGKVRLIEMFNGQIAGDPSEWRLNKEMSGGGALPDIGIYCLNTARYLLGEEPEYIQATMYSTPGDPRFTEVEESILFQLRFPGGTLVNAAASYGTAESRRYRCLADKSGWFGMDPAFPYKDLKMETTHMNDIPDIPQTDQFALEIDHMSLCVINDAEPHTPGEEGMKDQQLIEAIYASAKSGQPVYMPDPDNEKREMLSLYL